ncbi:MAG: outer membrane beta-barrel protein [Cocleimonas sp.]
MKLINKQTLVFGAFSISALLITTVTRADLPKAFDYSKASTKYVDNTSNSGGGGGGFEFGNVANPYYFGGTIGLSRGSEYCDGEGSNCEDEDTSWKLFGGYKLTDKISAEIAYTNLGDMHREDDGNKGANNADSSAFSFGAVGSLPITEQFDIFAKGAATRWSSSNESGLGISYGLGAKMHINETTNLRAEWERFPSIEVNGDDDTAVNMLSVGVELSTF